MSKIACMPARGSLKFQPPQEPGVDGHEDGAGRSQETPNGRRQQDRKRRQGTSLTAAGQCPANGPIAMVKVSR